MTDYEFVIPCVEKIDRDNSLLRPQYSMRSNILSRGPD